ncbi:ABC transporter permease subunit [Streptomyces graminilatus]|uniref:ABC transporter permease subunit n=1 Tax=Streptomyces graminilatus TaxID=1464070 RepID=UPI0006E2FD0A|nr:ABC transporter permease subunit [Streptomyces graminilatus]
MSTFTGSSNPAGAGPGTTTDGKNGTRNGTMNATTTTTTTNTSTSADTESVGTWRPRLSGMTWLVWRQHRAAFWTILAATALSVAWMVYQRGQMTDFLDSHGYPAKNIDDIGEQFRPYIDSFRSATLGLSVIPILLGVFLGAPLLAGDLENGTAKLVAAQSMSRTRWLVTKLGLAGLVVVVSTTALSAVFGWWWSPVKSEATVLEWFSGPAFDNTGPVPVGLTLLSVFGGVAIGVVLRRTLMAMVVTFGFTVAVQILWGQFRLSFGDVITVNTHKGVGETSFPSIPDGAYQPDQWYLTGSGDLVGWGICAEPTEAARNACLEKADVVGWSVEYIPTSQMNSMQWFGASVLFALTAAVVAFLVVWGRKRLV